MTLLAVHQQYYLAKALHLHIADLQTNIMCVLLAG